MHSKYIQKMDIYISDIFEISNLIAIKNTRDMFLCSFCTQFLNLDALYGMLKMDWMTKFSDWIVFFDIVFIPTNPALNGMVSLTFLPRLLASSNGELFIHIRRISSL